MAAGRTAAGAGAGTGAAPAPAPARRAAASWLATARARSSCWRSRTPPRPAGGVARGPGRTAHVRAWAVRTPTPIVRMSRAACRSAVGTSVSARSSAGSSPATHGRASLESVSGRLCASGWVTERWTTKTLTEGQDAVLAVGPLGARCLRCQQLAQAAEHHDQERLARFLSSLPAQALWQIAHDQGAPGLGRSL